MLRRLPAILLSVLILAVGLPTAAQDNSPWTVSAAQPLTLPTSVGLRIIPAPDGRQIAYESAVRLNGASGLLRVRPGCDGLRRTALLRTARSPAERLRSRPRLVLAAVWLVAG